MSEKKLCYSDAPIVRQDEDIVDIKDGLAGEGGEALEAITDPNPLIISTVTSEQDKRDATSPPQLIGKVSESMRREILPSAHWVAGIAAKKSHHSLQIRLCLLTHDRKVYSSNKYLL